MDKRYKPMSAQERNAARRALSDALTGDPSITIPAAIKKIRQTMRMTIEEYAALCDVAARSLSDIEREKTSPTLATVEKLLAPLAMRLSVQPLAPRDLNESIRNGSVRNASNQATGKQPSTQTNPTHIDINQSWELEYWAKKWAVTEHDIRAAVAHLGSNVADEVRQYLQSQTT